MQCCYACFARLYAEVAVASQGKYAHAHSEHPEMGKKMHLFLLWLISKQEMHGYEMLKRLKRDAGGVHAQMISAGRLYPLLNSMLASGLISQKVRKTGKRTRKVYVITAKGRAMLREGKKIFTGLIGQFVREMAS